VPRCWTSEEGVERESAATIVLGRHRGCEEHPELLCVDGGLSRKGCSVYSCTGGLRRRNPFALLILWGNLVALAWIAVACEPSTAPGHPARVAPHSLAASARGREPTFSRSHSRADYDRGMDGLAGLDALRGTEMTEALATDLGFRCAGLRDVPKVLAGESDPLVWRLVSRIDKTCNFDVPLACALFDIQRIESKRAAEAGTDLRGECAALKLAIQDVGTKYLQNPEMVDIIGKDLSYCGETDTVRVVRPVP